MSGKFLPVGILTVFGKLAEIVGQYLKKGRPVYVGGRLKTRKYTDKDGVEKYATDIIANEMQMLGGSPGGERGERSERPKPGPASYGGSEAPRTGGSQAPSRVDDFPDDDIPF